MSVLVLTCRTGHSARVVEYGELASVVLYRDLRGDRWKYAIYDSVGVWDGWLLDLTAAAPFDVAAEALAGFLQEHWGQSLRWPWVEQRPDWWAAGPAPM
jgi:hypothetical protein